MANFKVKEDVVLKVTSGSQLQGINILPQVGMIMPYAGASNNVPSGWLLCDGQTFSASIYPALYSYLGNSNVVPNLSSKSIVGTSVSGSVGLDTGSNNTHSHNFNYSASLDSAATPSHETAGAASNWAAVSGPAHAHNNSPNGNFTYNFGTPGNSNSFSNVPVNVTAGNQANVWNSTHSHSLGPGSIGYNTATVSHAHDGNYSTTTVSGNSHGHNTNVSGTTNSSSASHIPPGIYFCYIIKAG